MYYKYLAPTHLIELLFLFILWVLILDAYGRTVYFWEKLLQKLGGSKASRLERKYFFFINSKAGKEQP